jgi:hypothetical protein
MKDPDKKIVASISMLAIFFAWLLSKAGWLIKMLQTSDKVQSVRTSKVLGV